MIERRCRADGTSLSSRFQRSDRLTRLGYLHEDVHVECPSCGLRHTFGVPVEPRRDDPPKCPVCGGRFYPYKLEGETFGKDVSVYWKCEACYFHQERFLEHLVRTTYLLGVDHLVGRTDHE